ncbi:MAG TPA: hypothetical protein VK689_18145 [Armatimonadota bacterium]|nr:hypothetical protein [Armatimonadota bacterium]
MRPSLGTIFSGSGCAWGHAALLCAGALLLPSAAAAPPEAEEPLRPPRQVAHPVKDTREYVAPLTRLRNLRARYLDSEQWRTGYLDILGTWTSFLGNDREALACFDELDGLPGSPATPPRPHPLAGFRGLDARKTILQLAETHQVVMMNEAHHVPMHRAFTLSLLGALYRRGFRYFAAETLSTHDPELTSRGYPTLASGYYTMEPMHGELVRTALRLGYQVVPYEDERAVSPFTAADPVFAMNERERVQALNLKTRILDHDPRAKIVIHAGYGHISERATSVAFGGKSGELVVMAARFKAMTGIDPLTVDQTSRTEHSAPEYEHPVYRLAVESGHLCERPQLFRNRRGEFYIPMGAEGIYDLMVFHPRSRYVQGRPSWRRLNGNRTPHRLPKDVRPPDGSSYLAQAFDAGENPAVAIPLDQIELRQAERTPPLLLPRHGEFRVRVVDAGGRVVREYIRRR